jgi:chromosome segregation ATPase
MAPQTRLAKIQELETKHQSHIHEIDLVVKDEECRRLRVSSHFLRNEISSLQDQVAQKDKDMQGLAAREVKTRAALNTAQAACQTQEKCLKQQERDGAKLEAELKSLDGVSKEAVTAHTDKLAMTREIERLRPEIEHLRSQLADHKSTIAEKLALEHQVNSLEIQVESEKQSAQQIQGRLAAAEAQIATEEKAGSKARQEATASLEEMQQRLKEAESKLAEFQKQAQERIKGDDAQIISELRNRLEDSMSQIASEKKMASRAQKEADNTLSRANTKIEALQTKIEGLETKLQSTQDDLTLCRAELAELGQRKVALKEAHKISRSDALPKKSAIAKGGRKRPAVEVSMGDFTLQMHTPSADDKPRRALKRKVVEQSLLVEKSLFSITPFLAKTRTLGDDTAALEDSPSERVQQGEATSPATSTPVTRPEAPLPNIAEDAEDGEDRGEDDGLDELEAEQGTLSNSTDVPIRAKKAEKQYKPRGRPKKVLAESLGKKERVLKSTKPSITASSPSNTTPALEDDLPLGDALATGGEDGETRKKRRKLLGNKNAMIYEEVEDEGADIPLESMPPPKRTGKALVSGMGASSGARRLGKTVLGPAASKAFAGTAFSPLKRDRRGVNASFLA